MSGIGSPAIISVSCFLPLPIPLDATHTNQQNIFNSRLAVPGKPPSTREAVS